MFLTNILLIALLSSNQLWYNLTRSVFKRFVEIGLKGCSHLSSGCWHFLHILSKQLLHFQLLSVLNILFSQKSHIVSLVGMMQENMCVVFLRLSFSFSLAARFGEELTRCSVFFGDLSGVFITGFGNCVLGLEYCCVVLILQGRVLHVRYSFPLIGYSYLLPKALLPNYYFYTLSHLIW